MQNKAEKKRKRERNVENAIRLGEIAKDHLLRERFIDWVLITRPFCGGYLVDRLHE